MGKRKIEIEEIKDRQKRSVTFTKRRDGLFKKAETASQKFGGLQIGIVVFSPAGKPFTFFCNSSSSSSSVSSVDAIIDTYLSSSSSSSTCTTTSSSAMVVMGKRRSRSDDDVQEIETEKKRQKTMNAVVTPPPPCSITVEEEEEKLDEGFHWDDDHYKKNVDSDQTHHQEFRNNEFISSMGSGENEGIVVTGEMINIESSQFLVEGESRVPPYVVELQEIVNVEDDDFDHHHHCDEETTMGLLPPSDTNDEEDYGFTLEELEQILSTSPTVVVDTSYLNQEEEEEVPADNWPTQEFVQHLCS